jgi:hypothetical protein
LSIEEIEAITKEKSDHLERVIGERRAWHARIRECKTSDDVFAIYLDGMDQDKTDIPRLTNINIKEFGSNMKVR